MSIGIGIAIVCAYVVVRLVLRRYASPLAMVIFDVVAWAGIVLHDAIRFAIAPTLANGIVTLLMAVWIPYTIYEYRREAKP